MDELLGRSDNFVGSERQSIDLSATISGKSLPLIWQFRRGKVGANAGIRFA